MPTTFSSPGAAAAREIRAFLAQRMAEERQAWLDGLAVDDRMKREAREQMEAQRRAKLDQQADEDRRRRIQAEDEARDLGALMPGDVASDALAAKYPGRFNPGGVVQGPLPDDVDQRDPMMREQIPATFVGTPEQRAAATREATRVSERDADIARDELRDKDAAANRYLDSELRRHEAQRDRESAERIVRLQMAGKDKGEGGHDAAAVTLDALDELSGSAMSLSCSCARSVARVVCVVGRCRSATNADRGV